MKKFIITIDTEGDNQWEWEPNKAISTQNTKYLYRFQAMANNYGFKPVWLSNYDMLSDNDYIKFISEVEANNLGELGMHLHAWSTPPDYQLPISENYPPYLIEYPDEIIEEKISNITNLIKKETGITPISHRAGRWAMNDKYISLLSKYGYKVDCSVTPHINWSDFKGQTASSQGTNYASAPERPYMWGDIFEVPLTIRKSHNLFFDSDKSLRNIAASVYRAFKGKYIWLRPTGKNYKEMAWLLNYILSEDVDYIMFMIHSSELMPAGSPTFRTVEAIEKMYEDLDSIFKIASQNYEGCTLREYFKIKFK